MIGYSNHPLFDSPGMSRQKKDWDRTALVKLIQDGFELSPEESNELLNDVGVQRVADALIHAKSADEAEEKKSSILQEFLEKKERIRAVDEERKRTWPGVIDEYNRLRSPSGSMPAIASSVHRRR